MIHNPRQNYHNVFMFPRVGSSFSLNARGELGGHILVTVIMSNRRIYCSHATNQNGLSRNIVHTVRPVPSTPAPTSISCSLLCISPNSFLTPKPLCSSLPLQPENRTAEWARKEVWPFLPPDIVPLLVPGRHL